MPLWNVQVYTQGELISIDIVEESEVQPMTLNYENKGYEVRSEPAWTPAQSISRLPEVMPHPRQWVDFQSNQELLK